MSLVDIVTKQNCTELKKLVTEHPELPLLVFSAKDVYGDYEQTGAHIYKDRLTLYHDTWLNEDELEDRLIDTLCDEAEYRDLSNEEFDKAIKDIVNETEFIETICVFAD